MDDQPAHEQRRYDPRVIESRWQQRWANDGLYQVGSDDLRDACDKLTDGTNVSRVTGNTVAPEHHVHTHSVDTLRLAILAARPASEDVDFEHLQLDGCERFLNRVWRLAATPTNEIRGIRGGNPTEVDDKVAEATHRLIDRVTGEYNRLAFNAAVAGFMKFTNSLYAYIQLGQIGGQSSEHSGPQSGAHGPTLGYAVDSLLQLMAPAVPHITAELWARRHDNQHIHTRIWPQADPQKLVDSTATMVIQVNGKVRDRVVVDVGISSAEAETLALTSERIQGLLGEAQPTRVIVRLPKLVNIVVGINGGRDAN